MSDNLNKSLNQKQNNNNNDSMNLSMQNQPKFNSLPLREYYDQTIT